MPTSSCRVETGERAVALVHPAFTIQLDPAAGLAMAQWTSQLTGQAWAITGGVELSATVDSARQRIEILGWRQRTSSRATLPPDQDDGFRQRFHDPFHPDADWGAPSPAGYSHRIPAIHSDQHETNEQERKYTWARTHFVLPETARGEELFIGLGGYGLFDFDYLRAFVNGEVIGLREVSGRWREPGLFRIGPADRPYSRLRFGQDNVLALQLKGFYTRPARLERLDATRSLALYSAWVGLDALFDQFVSVGAPAAPVAFAPVAQEITATGNQGEFRVTLRSPLGIEAVVDYRWSAESPLLTKHVVLENLTDRPIPLLDLTLGDYRLATGTADNGDVGFPVYVDEELFVSLTHPVALNQLDHGRLRLRHFLGQDLPPGERLELPSAVYGFAARGEGRAAFQRHLATIGRRPRQHRGPTSTFFPMRNDESFFIAETHEQTALEGLVKLQDQRVVSFDNFLVGYFVIDAGGDFIQFDRQRWPNGSEPFLARLKASGLKLGLGLSGTSPIGWSIGSNPAVAGCMNTIYSSEGFCMAAEPYQTLVQHGMREYVRRWDMAEFVIDEVYHRCQNPHHGHRIGNYSMTANANASIQLFELLDHEAPDLFIQLYWGYRSPWWLRWADTLFEPGGIKIEARNPGERPTLHFRDSITLALDRAHDYADEIPRWGKDSLGIWLTDNQWNSYVGADRWAEGLVLDLCRGSLLAQFFGQPGLLTDEQWRVAGRLLGVWKAHPECFSKPRLLGSPWTDDVYGYCCTDGARAFIALNNCSWSDQQFELALDRRWGLADGASWRLRRWYPTPAELTTPNGELRHAPGTRIALRPFEIVLLEAIPAGLEWGGADRFPTQPIPQPATEPARSLPLTVVPLPVAPVAESVAPAMQTLVTADGGYAPERAELLAAPVRQQYRITGVIPAVDRPGTLAVVVRLFTGKYPARLGLDSVNHLKLTGSLAGEPLAFTPVVRRAEVSWQVYRTGFVPAPAVRALELCLSSTLSPEQVSITPALHLLPGI